MLISGPDSKNSQDLNHNIKQEVKQEILWLSEINDKFIIKTVLQSSFCVKCVWSQHSVVLFTF